MGEVPLYDRRQVLGPYGRALVATWGIGPYSGHMMFCFSKIIWWFLNTLMNSIRRPPRPSCSREREFFTRARQFTNQN